MKFKHLKDYCSPSYPIGEYYDSSYQYVINVAEVINNTFKDPQDHLILVVRGSSGCILGGGVAYLLTKMGRTVSIAISRKDNEDCHGTSLAGIYTTRNRKIIIIDDFIETGNTISSIVKEVYDLVSDINKINMLCVSNRFSKLLLTVRGQNMKELLNNFEYICCSKP